MTLALKKNSKNVKGVEANKKKFTIDQLVGQIEQFKYLVIFWVQRAKVTKAHTTGTYLFSEETILVTFDFDI